MNKHLLGLSVFLIFQFTHSQTFQSNTSICNDCENDLALEIESTSFIKNNEYKSLFTKGFTGIGFFIKPSLSYYLNHNTKINFGVYLLKYSGRDAFSDVLPVFRIQHKITPNFQLVFGNIFGALNHKIIEPIYRFDRYYQQNIEYGLQFLYDGPIFKSDLWLSWEKFIFPDDPFQEEIVTGNTSELRLLNFNKITLSALSQFVIFHKGGEIDSSPDSKYSIINGVFGLNLNIQNSSSRRFVFEPQYSWFAKMHFSSDQNLANYKNGKALYFKVKYETNSFNTMLGYWRAKNYFAPKGEYLFQSVSENDESLYNVKRQLYTGKLAYKKSIGNSIKLELGINGYYDIEKSQLDYSYGFFFVFDETIFIKKLKKKLPRK